MSTSTADTIRRREKAARAAELRLQAKAPTMATASSTAFPTQTACCDSKTELRHPACKTTHVSTGSGSGGRGEIGASRKRPAEQVGFSDSDSDEVACVGVSAALQSSTQGRGSKGAATAGSGGGASSSKRGRTDGVSDQSNPRRCPTSSYEKINVIAFIIPLRALHFRKRAPGSRARSRALTGQHAYSLGFRVRPSRSGVRERSIRTIFQNTLSSR